MPSFLRYFKDDHFRSTTRSQHGDARETDRTGAMNDSERAGANSAGGVHEGVIDNRERLNHRAAVVQLFVASELTTQRPYRPAIARGNPHILREPAIQAEPDL